MHRRQEDLSGLPMHSPGDLPHPGIEPASFTYPVFVGSFLPLAPPGRLIYMFKQMVLKYGHCAYYRSIALKRLFFSAYIKHINKDI